MSLIVFMGSGETAPAMVKVHRQILEQTGPGPRLMLDTPFGFQNNADDLVARTQQYFRESVGADVEVASWRRGDLPNAAAEQALAAVSQSRWLFAGPGSPTYALRHWMDTPVPAAMNDLLDRGGTVVFGSAAAVTAGAFALPVYEIYKVGAEPAWVDGLDLLGPVLGTSVAVVPHYDNAEGGTYDTRYCYLGEQRLSAMEAQLPEASGVIGIDEHTAVVLDLAARTVRVRGVGSLTLRHAGQSRRFASGTTLTFEDLVEVVQAGTGSGQWSEKSSSPESDEPIDDAAGGQPSLERDVARHREVFDAALATGDAAGCATAILDLESALRAWATDSLQSDAMDRGRRELRAMIVRLGEFAATESQGLRDQLTPVVGILLQLRDRSRDGRDFATADFIRDRLAAAGIEVRDAPEGTTWHTSKGPQPKLGPL